MLSGKNLFCSKDKRRQIKIRRPDLIDELKVGTEKIWGHFTLGANVSIEFKSMAEKMLAFEPKERWSFEEVLASEWMQGERFNSEEMRNMFQDSLTI